MNVRLWLIQDWLVAGHVNCALWWHLDSIPPEITSVNNFPDGRVWESHVDTGARRIVKPTPKKTLPVYAVNEPACMPADQVVVAVSALRHS